MLAGLDQHLPHAAAHLGGDQMAVQIGVVMARAGQRLCGARIVVLPQLDFGLEGGFLLALEGGDIGGVVGDEAVVGGEVEFGLLDADLRAALAEGFAELIQLGLADRVEAHLIEEAQQPGLTVLELGVLHVLVPDRQGATDQLVAAGRVHAVDAHVHAADAHGAFGGVGARRVVLGAEQAMARVQRHGAGRVEVDITEAEDQVAGIKQDVFDLIAAGQAIGALDEVDVVRQPGRLAAHGFAVALDGSEGGAVLEGHGQVDDPGRHLELGDITELALQAQQVFEQGALVQHAAVVAQLQRAHAGASSSRPRSGSALSASISRCTRRRRARSSTLSPYSSRM